MSSTSGITGTSGILGILGMSDISCILSVSGISSKSSISGISSIHGAQFWIFVGEEMSPPWGGQVKHSRKLVLFAKGGQIPRKLCSTKAFFARGGQIANKISFFVNQVYQAYHA